MGMDSPTSNSPLLTCSSQDQYAAAEEQQQQQQQPHYKSASTPSAVFSLSTAIVGAGIIGLPATIRITGVLPGFFLIVFFAFFTNASLDFLLKYSKASKAVTYGGVMYDAFGRSGRIFLQVVIVVSGYGGLVIYLIIMADVLSGSTSASMHHSGVLEEWAGGRTWWNGRSAVMFFTTVFILFPLVSLRRIEMLIISRQEEKGGQHG